MEILGDGNEVDFRNARIFSLVSSRKMIIIQGFVNLSD